MNKPLTIEELKALPLGEWVWVIDKCIYGNGIYCTIDCQDEDAPYCILSSCINTQIYEFSKYGKTWLAYKNKEQAEGEDKDMIERIEKAYEHNVAECERCMKKVDMKHQFAMESMKEHIRKETAKEIFDEVIEACTVQLNAAEVDEYDNRYSKAWGRYWEGKITGAMDCRADILDIAKKYGVEVDE